MPKGRKPTPRLVGLATRANIANPAKFKKEEPVNPNAIGEPPLHLNPGAKRAWEEILQRAVPGVLTQADEHIVELLSMLISDLRTDPEFSAAKMAHLRQGLGSLGMTPADRMRLAKTPGKDDGNPFDAF